MKGEDAKYDKILRMLRESVPDMPHYRQTEDKIIEAITPRTRNNVLSGLVDAVFGWVYINWVRKSLATASFILAGIFIYQQAVIVRQVKDLSRQVVMSGAGFESQPAYDVNRIMHLKMSGQLQLFPDRKFQITPQQIEDLVRSYGDLQVKYNDLLKIINEDPALKEYIEKRLNLNTEPKPDL